MKIAHVVWQMSTGGAESMLVDIANIQAESEKVLVIAINDNQNPMVMNKLNPNVEFFSCGRQKKSRSITPFFRLNKKLFSFKPDIVHNHFGDLYKYEFFGKNKVWTIHNTGYPSKYFKHYKRCFAISNSVKNEWKNLGYDVVVVENGINCRLIREKKNFNRNSIVNIVQISRLLTEQKGQDLLIRAIEILVKEKKEKNVKVHFIGDGPDRNKLENLVNEKDLNDFICFMGLKDREWIYNHLCEFDLLVQPSRFEGFGLTVAEACVAKVPVLVSDNEGPLEILDEGVLAMTFKNKDVDDLADKLFYFLNNCYDQTLLEKASRRICEKYDVKKTSKKYIEEYEKLLCGL